MVKYIFLLVKHTNTRILTINYHDASSTFLFLESKLMVSNGFCWRAWKWKFRSEKLQNQRIKAQELYSTLYFEDLELLKLVFVLFLFKGLTVVCLASFPIPLISFKASGIIYSGTSDKCCCILTVWRALSCLRANNSWGLSSKNP